MADNSAALARARRHDSRAKRQRAADAIRAVEGSGEPISFPAVARGWDMRPLLDGFEQRAAELEADNHRLRRLVAQLENDAGELTDDIDAARATNRDLMNELNRRTHPGPTADHHDDIAGRPITRTRQ